MPGWLRDAPDDAWLGEIEQRPPSRSCTTTVEIGRPATGCCSCKRRETRFTLLHTAWWTDGCRLTRANDMTPAARRMLWCGILYGSSSAGHSNHHTRDLSMAWPALRPWQTLSTSSLRWSLCTCAGRSLSAASPAPGTKRGRLHVEPHPGARHKPIVRRAPALALLSRKLDYATADPPKLRPQPGLCTPALAGARPMSFCSGPSPVAAPVSTLACFTQGSRFRDEHIRSLLSLADLSFFTTQSLFSVCCSSRSFALTFQQAFQTNK